MDVKEIQEVLPHRYPFLLVDRMVELIPTKRGRGVKNVTVNEPFFVGHFPGNPIMPGVLLLEALAQTASVVMLCAEPHRGRVAFFAGADKVRFRKPVVPGDQLIMDVEILWHRGNFGRVKAVGLVDDAVVVEAEIAYYLGDR